MGTKISGKPILARLCGVLQGRLINRNGKFIVVLDIDKVLNAQELKRLIDSSDHQYGIEHPAVVEA